MTSPEKPYQPTDAEMAAVQKLKRRIGGAMRVRI